MKRMELVRSGLLAVLDSLAVAAACEDALTTFDRSISAHVERVG
ncbi:hypothetical protein [Rhodanobacter sp. T12-5]|nr:hypothetical protein [Rhodanobacter sp. T12-5]